MSAKELTIPEMQKAITEYKAELTTLKTTIDTFKAEVEATKKAESEKEEIKKKVEEGPNNEGKNAKFHKAMKAAMDEKDEGKKAEYMKEAMKHYKAESDGDEDKKKDAETKKEDDEEKEAMKAELAKSRLQVLTASYTGRVDEKKLKEFTAQWNKMSFKQLDAEIDKIKPFAARTIIPKQEEQPLGFSTLQFSGSTDKDEYSAKVEKMSDAELFGGKF